jgi:N-methylhydantoinase A
MATDIGGTFTDLVALDEDSGKITLAKSSSTPPEFQRGLADAIRKSGLDPRTVAFFVHGTTVVINALTERKGAPTALVTTRGFRDVLEITRANRPDMYNLRFEKQAAFVPRHLRFEVDERVGYKGDVMKPLDEGSVRVAADQIKALGVSAVAICFLHSYANPTHEARCAEMLEELLPGVLVTPSHAITQEWREYERTSAAVLNSYVRPVASNYLDSLFQDLRKLQVPGSLNVMKSNGGMSSFGFAKEQPIHMIESGPVGGVVGAVAIGMEIGERNLITLDIGGTTAKTSLIEGLEVKVTTEYRIEHDARRAGYPVKVPVVDIVEIGAGGGSIAWLDPIGTLRVGPRSAGAVPGPASYTHGGTEPTVTDANLLLGRINPRYFLGGEMPMSVEQAHKAAEKLAVKLGMPVDEVARGIVRLANANMVNAIKLVSVRKGHDPREYTLVAFGGGGPMHATALARELHIRKVIIPPAPGNFSAWGMLTTDYKQDFTRTTVLRATDETMSSVYRRYDELERDALLFFKHEGFDAANVVTARAADMRYAGQEHTVRVPVPDGHPTLADVTARFHERHESAFMFRLDGPVEFVNLHVTGFVRVPNPDLTAFAPTAARGTATKGRRKVDFDQDGIHDAALFERGRLALDEEVKGPAIVEEEASTTVIYPGQSARLDRIGNLVIETGV